MIEEYIEKLLSQVRCVKARTPIEEELMTHLEEQTECYMKDGADRENAEAMAVADMGDPIETGIEMDRIHRPKMDYKLIFLIAIMSILSLLLQAAINNIESNINVIKISRAQLLYTVAGLLLMMLVCYVDYTRIANFAKAGAIAVNLLLFLILLTPYLDYSAISILDHLTSLLSTSRTAHLTAYLYIPFFGGILYGYKNQGKKGLVKAFLWMAVPIIAVWGMSNLVQMVSLFMVMILQISFTMWKGWFGAGRKSAVLCGTSVLWLPLLCTCYILLFTKGFRYNRLISFYPWLQNYFHMVQGDVHWVPNAGEELAALSRYDHASMASAIFGENYLIRFIFSYYGILAACLFVLLLVVFVLKLFKVSIRQKNQLGQVMGVGCSLTFAIQTGLYLLVNIDFLPRTDCSLPLFSHGLTGCTVSYALLGVLLSIYRYQNVCAANPKLSGLKEILVTIHGVGISHR